MHLQNIPTERFENHPDTNFKFDGFILNDWDKIKLIFLIMQIRHLSFRRLHGILLFWKDKISVIEINSDYGIDHLQCCIGGMRRKLNINPEFPENEYLYKHVLFSDL